MKGESTAHELSDARFVMAAVTIYRQSVPFSGGKMLFMPSYRLLTHRCAIRIGIAAFGSRERPAERAHSH
jgi:hypothetical protein